MYVVAVNDACKQRLVLPSRSCDSLSSSARADFIAGAAPVKGMTEGEDEGGWVGE